MKKDEPYKISVKWFIGGEEKTMEEVREHLNNKYRKMIEEQNKAKGSKSTYGGKEDNK